MTGRNNILNVKTKNVLTNKVKPYNILAKFLPDLGKIRGETVAYTLYTACTGIKFNPRPRCIERADAELE